VTETSGQVTVQHGAETRPLQRGAVLAEGDVVMTRGNARAVLVHDLDFVTLAPNSRVSIPRAAAEATGLTKLMQTLGNAVYKIQKLGVPHFGVSTPYLAAVVKGTTFSVTVDASGSSLQVTEGAVEVATLDGGARDLIRPGDVASIAAGDMFRLQVQGNEQRTLDSPARGTPATPAVAPAGSSSSNAAPALTAPEPQPVMAIASAPETDGGFANSTTSEFDAPMIKEAIFAKPADLGTLTGGLLTGAIAPAVVVVAATVDRVELAAATRTAATPPTPSTDASTPRPEAVEVAPGPVPAKAAEPNNSGPAKNDTPPSDTPKDVPPRADSGEPKSDDKPKPDAPAPKDDDKPKPDAPAPKEDDKPKPDAPAPKDDKPKPDAPAPKDDKPKPDAPAPKDDKPKPDAPTPKDDDKPKPDAPAPKDDDKPKPDAPAPKDDDKPKPDAPAPKDDDKPRPDAPAPGDDDKPKPGRP
jgi:hypothetical protein